LNQFLGVLEGCYQPEANGMELALWIVVGLIATYLAIFVILRFIFPNDT